MLSVRVAKSQQLTDVSFVCIGFFTEHWAFACERLVNKLVNPPASGEMIIFYFFILIFLALFDSL